ncbi:TRAP transporter, DctM subunit [Tistlia consotensis]|uniref:TRAP transporter large permease protein n=1 Tax=Tistlia consotensis USBA 355 TaxID=560819 RepID=A0A1Y6CBM8_9PROT|nr:TRAP transporter large permease subunit [Tistlia consotensis]SMF53754.1 TRAP transporter, DctM subunit [Tistlia consotensis USBA 355]SNR85974.1 TRAP transporter, DctM subunit [Tistlia consotensis]
MEALLMFPALFLLIFLGFPVAFSLMSVAFVFGVMTFDLAAFFQFTQKIEDVATNFVLAAVPLFVFMGAMLERSGIAESLFDAVHLWTRRLPGGLAVGTVVMCIIFAASTGVIGATETVVGLLAIPAMMRFNYRNSLISGTICAGGSLGTIIPPSVVVVVLGPIANVSIGDLMVGMIIPGLILSALYVLYILAYCLIDKDAGPRVPPSADDPDLATKLAITLKALLPPMLMIVAVLGSIMGGIAAPTEAAALGALGSILLTLLYRRFTLATFGEALVKTLTVTSMIMLILLAGSLFTGVFAATGGMMVMTDLLNSVNLGPWGMIFLFLGMVFIAGFFLEWISILLIFVPLFMPFVNSAGFDPLWFSMLILIMIQTSYLTPPMAPAIFYLRGIAPPEMTLQQMYWGVVPFILLQVVVMVVVMLFPETVTWLPDQLLGFK